MRSYISRRVFNRIMGSGLLVSSVGCRDEDAGSDNGDSEPSTTTSSVPLRVWVAGKQSDAEIIRRGWSSISSQPLDIEVVAFDRLSSEEFSRRWADRDSIAEASKSADLFVVPHVLTVDMIDAKAIVPIVDDALDEVVRGLYPSLRAGLCNYGGDNYSIPISSALPALMTTKAMDEQVQSWNQYADIVQQWDGQASEPTAAGWAGMMFMWRASGQVQRWLFDQSTFEAAIADDDYIDVLTEMKRCHDRYSATQLSPMAIESRIAEGAFLGGIGYPSVGLDDGSSTINVSELPANDNSSRVLLDTMSPVVALSSNCRQSAASKAFIGWICGGDGSEATRDQLPGVFPVSGKGSGERSSRSASPFQSMLARRLSHPVTSPNLTIMQGHHYYARLDEGIRSCLDDDESPSDALGQVSRQWNELTDRIGADKQARCWRRAKGMRS